MNPISHRWLRLDSLLADDIKLIYKHNAEDILSSDEKVLDLLGNALEKIWALKSIKQTYCPMTVVLVLKIAT